MGLEEGFEAVRAKEDSEEHAASGGDTPRKPPRNGANAGSAQADRNRRRSQPRSPAKLSFVLVAGVALSVAAFSLLQRGEADRVEAELRYRSSGLASAIRQTLQSEFALLETVARFLEVDSGESRDTLARYARGAAQSGPAIWIDWVPRVRSDKRATYEEQQWLAGTPGFTVTQQTSRGDQEPVSPRQDYFPLHLGPESKVSLAGATLHPGSDLGAIPALRPLLAAAERSKVPILSDPLPIEQQDSTFRGVLLLLPVRASAPSPTRRVATLGHDGGFVLAAYRVDEWFENVVPAHQRGFYAATLRDLDLPPDDRTIWSTRPVAEVPQTALAHLWEWTGPRLPQWSVTIETGGRRFLLATRPSPRLIASTVGWDPWIVLAFGLFMTSLMAAAMQRAELDSAKVAKVDRNRIAERREADRRRAEIEEALERERADRRRTENSLFREKQQFRLMFSAVPAMIWYKDTKNRFLLVNEAGAQWMGRSVEEIEGSPCADLFPDDAYEMYRHDLEIIQTGKPMLGIVEEVEGPSGEIRWISTDKVPEYDAKGRVVGILIFSQDVSERRHAEAEIHRLNEELEARVAERTGQLQAANQELESFAYSVSHDLRTPLRSIDGFSQVLLEEYQDKLDEDARGYLERVRAASQRMGHLIDDLLQLTRVSREDISRQPIVLSAMAADIIEEKRSADSTRAVEFVVEETPEVSGDPTLIRNVVQNLIDNAWKFTAHTEDPRIEFGAEVGDDGVPVFHVRDNGVGFDMMYADKLFGAFQRLHGSTEFEGSGIGLATAQLIVRRHGGRIWAEGEPEKGAAFYFTVAPTKAR